MDTMMRRLLILLWIVLLAGCAQEADRQTQPTSPPPPDTPTASPTPAPSPTPQPGDAAADQETATATQQIAASPTPTSTAPPTREEATTTPIPQIAEPETTGSVAGAAEVLTPLRLQNMTYSNQIVPAGQVTLENGVYEEQAAPGSAAQIRVALRDMMAFGEVGGEYHAAVVSVIDGGGSGTFYTLHLVGLEDGEPHEMASILLGDRVLLHDLAIVDGRVEVDLTRAGPDDPLCCPTERAHLVYALQDDALVLEQETVLAPPPPAEGSTADIVDRGLTLDVNGVASMYAWTIERSGLQAIPPLPGHLLMTFDGPTSDEVLTDDDPQLSIFPLVRYQELAGPVEDQVARLWQLVETDHERSGGPQGWMPLLPPANAPVVDWSDFAALDFVHGHGIRYLRLVGGELAYTYLGVTEDGRYIVSLTWPLGADDAPDLEALDAMIASLALGEAHEEQ